MEIDYNAYRVLVADDEATVAQAFAADITRRFGCPVKTVFEGDEVLQTLGREPFDILVTDMVMPGCHGLDLVERVVSEFPGVDILVTTAYPADFPYVDVVRAGASDFVAKPHLPQELQAKLIRIMRERALLAELDLEKRRILQDMEAMQHLRDERAAAETKYRNLFEYGLNGMLVVSPDTHVIRDVNHSFSATCDISRDSLIGRPFLDLFEEAGGERLRQGLVILKELGRATFGDIMLRSANGSSVCLDVSITLIRVDPEDIVHVVCQDVTEQREMQRQLAEIAQTDQLTGLFNKRSFAPRLDAAIARARNEGQPLTLLFLDLDDFKRCNDTYGHPAGDSLLSALGQMILKHTRARLDSAFRYGGDEFAILLSQADISTGRRVAERIREDFHSQNNYETSLSIGASSYRDSMTSAQLLKEADEALYRAKQAGKNQTCAE